VTTGWKWIKGRRERNKGSMNNTGQGKKRVGFRGNNLVQFKEKNTRGNQRLDRAGRAAQKKQGIGGSKQQISVWGGEG